jgi:ATP-dependent DNA helicase RecQ
MTMASALGVSALRETLSLRFGLEGWRPGQERVITSVLAGRDTLAIMPTGAGKSLCYQLPALHLSGLTLVVSPLIALMKDQAEKLEVAGIENAQLNSALTTQQEAAMLERIAAMHEGIVFVTPERLADERFLQTLRTKSVALLVVDEAHCISQWGHDFRPAFLEIGTAIHALNRPPVLALTATATARVIDDIRTQLGLTKLRVINTGLYRPNLRYEVLPVQGEDRKLIALIERLRDSEGTGIVYCATVKSVDALHESLQRAGVCVTRYHGRLSARERDANQDAFMSGQNRIMVATNAFGMGIDKADLRFIIHYQMPGSLEAYYQESGRAGRDGKPADCVLMFDTRDKQVQQFFLARRYPGVDELSSVWVALCKETQNRDRATLKELQEVLPKFGSSRLRITLKLLEQAGLLLRTEDGGYQLSEMIGGLIDFQKIADDYALRAERDQIVLEQMIAYAQSSLCRWGRLLEYFGVRADRQRCGHCDNCERPSISVDPDMVRRAENDAAWRARKPVPVTDADDALAAETAEMIAPVFSTGHRVRVSRYGHGEITDITDTHATVRFADGASRTFLQSYLRPAGRAPRHRRAMTMEAQSA